MLSTPPALIAVIGPVECDQVPGFLSGTFDWRRVRVRTDSPICVDLCHGGIAARGSNAAVHFLKLGRCD